MLNQVVIMGRVVRDPEMRRTGSGIAVTSFTVAVDRDFADKQTKERETDFLDCVAWRQAGEFVAKYFPKGSMIVVSGRLQVRTWNDKKGNKRRSTEIVADNVYFGSSKPADKNTSGNNGGYSAPAAPAGNNAPAPAAPSYGAATPNYGGYNYGGGYATPASDFTMLDDSDAQLPF